MNGSRFPTAPPLGLRPKENPNVTVQAGGGRPFSESLGLSNAPRPQRQIHVGMALAACWPRDRRFPNMASLLSRTHSEQGPVLSEYTPHTCSIETVAGCRQTHRPIPRASCDLRLDYTLAFLILPRTGKGAKGKRPISSRRFPRWRDFSSRSFEMHGVLRRRLAPNEAFVREVRAQTPAPQFALLEKLAKPEEPIWYRKATTQHGCTARPSFIRSRPDVFASRGKAVARFR